METKICNKCKLNKNVEEFRLKKQNQRYIRYYICKDCEKTENSIQCKKYRKNHKEYFAEYNKNYREKNREKLNKYWLEYKKNKYKNNNLNKFIVNIRRDITRRFNLKGFSKTGNTKTILGCDFNTFYKHLLLTFKDNYGYEWNGTEPVHIDHIKPLKYAQTEEEVIKLCHYTNLQLLKKQDNLEKGAKLDWTLKKGEQING